MVAAGTFVFLRRYRVAAGLCKPRGFHRFSLLRLFRKLTGAAGKILVERFNLARLPLKTESHERPAAAVGQGA